MHNVTLYENIPDSFSPVKLVWNDNMKNHGFSPHWHEHLEIHYICSGKSVWKCEEEMVEIKAGECLVVNSNELHGWMGGDGAYMCVLLFPEILGENSFVFNRIIRDESIVGIMKNIVSEFRDPQIAGSAAINGYGYLLFSELCRKGVFRNFSEAEYEEYSKKMLTFNRAVKYIYDNCTRKITLDEAADMMHLNKHYFCHVFKSLTGKTLKEYVNGVRIDKAAGLLRSTGLSVTEVAFLCGFNDSNYFSRKFRQVKGMSPLEFRKTE